MEVIKFKFITILINFNVIEHLPFVINSIIIHNPFDPTFSFNSELQNKLMDPAKSWEEQKGHLIFTKLLGTNAKQIASKPGNHPAGGVQIGEEIHLIVSFSKTLKQLIYLVQNFKCLFYKHYSHGLKTKYISGGAILGQRYSQDLEVSLVWRGITLKLSVLMRKGGGFCSSTLSTILMMKNILYMQ